MFIDRRRFLIASIAGAATLAWPAQAAQFKVFQRDGIAINGIDPVAYFTEERPVEGSEDFTLDWNSAIWLFASAANRDEFAAMPEKFAPQYGGYCAYAVAKGYTASTDPKAWSIYEGKLYLNYSRPVRALWALDKTGYVLKANNNWPKVLDQ